MAAQSGDEVDEVRVAMAGLLRTTKLLASISLARRSPQVSLAPDDHSLLWPFTSPSTMKSGESRGAIEARNPGGHEEAGGM